MKNYGTKISIAAVVLTLGFWCAVAESEPTLDLTTAGSSGTINGALFEQWDGQPTGTGVFDPFVRIQRIPPPPHGIEAGYNTDGIIEFDTKDDGGHNWTHSLLLSDLNPVMVKGTEFYQFALDIDETNARGGRTGPLLSLDELEIYLQAGPSEFPYSSFVNKVYDLDNGGDNWILLDYSLNSGSGSGDMVANIPASLFTGGDYVYLYSQFGLGHNGYKNGADDGFEEWAAGIGPNIIPAPGAIFLGGIGVGLVGWLRRHRTLQ